jgi:hypothetical protein
MSDKTNSVIPNPVPYAVRRKVGMKLAGVGSTEFQKRVNSGRYQSFLDGTLRYVITQSIIDDQKRLAEKANAPAPLGARQRKAGPSSKNHPANHLTPRDALLRERARLSKGLSRLGEHRRFSPIEGLDQCRPLPTPALSPRPLIGAPTGQPNPYGLALTGYPSARRLPHSCTVSRPRRRGAHHDDVLALQRRFLQQSLLLSGLP